jgi:hypothetical protein
MKIVVSPKSSKVGMDVILDFPYSKLREGAAQSEIHDLFLERCDGILDRYISPRRYMEWNEYVKICLATGSIKSLESCFCSSDVIGAVACTTFRSAIIDNASARYVSEDIVESFMQTPLPELPPEVASVLPYVHLMLPRNTVYDCEGDEVISILVQSGKLYSDKISEDHEFLTKTFFPGEKIAPSELLGANGIQIVTLTKAGVDVFQEFISKDAKGWHESNVKYTGHSKYEDEKTEKIIRIAINSLLVHLYEPELITTDSRPPTRGIGFSSNAKRPLPATWIGKTFKNDSKKNTAKNDSVVQGNVRSHWRRGHWHSVCVGPKRSERRVQWFKPIYVNPVAKSN